MPRRRALPVRMFRWFAGDKKPKAPDAAAAAKGRAKAAATNAERTALPALNFDPTTWLHTFVTEHPDGAVVIRDRVSNGIIYECAAAVILASGASLLQHMRADLGDGHYYIQGRYTEGSGAPTLGEAHALTVGTPPPLALVQAINTASKSQDAMTQVDNVLSIVNKAEPIIDRLLGRGGGVADQVMAAALENLLNPPNQIEQLVESKRLLAELTAPVGGAPVAPVAGATPGGQIAQGIGVLAALQDLARSMRGGERREPMTAQTETKRPATATAAPTPQEAGAPADESVAAMAAKAVDDPMGQMILQKLHGACASNNPQMIAHVLLSTYDAAVVMDWDGPLKRQFKADPGAVFDELHRHLAPTVATPSEVFAAAREIVVGAVGEFVAAEAAGGAPVDSVEDWADDIPDDSADDAADDSADDRADDSADDGADDSAKGGVHDEAGSPTLTVVVNQEPGRAAG